MMTAWMHLDRMPVFFVYWRGRFLIGWSARIALFIILICMDGIEIQKPFPNRNEPKDFSFNLNGGFDATPWDVDDFFEPD
ncbi:hypothetical protein F2Q70_00002476 [Brassica cretica]|uniref:Uncharacterized protein n=1 Tax=Brassica cretica TaxID=69181 RepID=A0A8S9IUJ5_BRACR|nr:hypothetical protein F2Q70_00002476 [Brassica cretica]KAF3561146.1 hypothetical protein DY000_02013932 [Brassica cretica]